MEFLNWLVIQKSLSWRATLSHVSHFQTFRTFEILSLISHNSLNITRKWLHLSTTTMQTSGMKIGCQNLNKRHKMLINICSSLIVLNVVYVTLHALLWLPIQNFPVLRLYRKHIDITQIQGIIYLIGD